MRRSDVNLRCCLLFILVSAPLIAQNLAIRGQVTDESGAVIPGANVVLNGPSGLVQNTKAGADGSYSFPNLGPGQYMLGAPAPQLILREPVTVSLSATSQRSISPCRF